MKELPTAEAPERHGSELIFPLVQNLADGVTVIEADGRFSFVNDAAARLLGFPSARALQAASPSEIGARHELFDADGAPLAVDRLPSRRAFAEGKSVEGLFRFRVKGSTEVRWAMMSSTPALDAAGRVERVLTLFRDRTERRRSEESMRFLSAASQLLNASLDVEETLQAVVRAAVPVLADWCALELVTPGGGSRQVAVAHPDPAKERLAWEFREKWPDPPDAPNGVPHVLRTGEAELVPVIPPELLERVTRGPEHLAAIRALELHSYIVVPLIARGRTLGALTLVSAESRRVFGEKDLENARSLAGRAAVALDNAQLHAELHRERERLTVALEAGRLGTWEWDFGRQRVFWSAAVERIHGLAEGSFGGTLEEYRGYTHPDDRERVAATVRDLVERRQREYEIAYRIVRPDGAVRWLEGRALFSFDEKGAPLRLTGVCSDVTDRRAAEAEQARLHQELLNAQRLFQSLVENLPGLAWSALPDGKIDFYNRRWYEYTGTNFEQMQGWGWKSVHDPAMLDQVVERWQASIHTGMPFEMEFPLRRADGQLRWFLTRVNPLRDGEGRIVRWFGTNIDIHDQREARRRTEALLAEVSEQVVEMETAMRETRAAREAAERRTAELERQLRG